jgi:hypothetical protein
MDRRDCDPECFSLPEFSSNYCFYPQNTANVEFVARNFYG